MCVHKQRLESRLACSLTRRCETTAVRGLIGEAISTYIRSCTAHAISFGGDRACGNVACTMLCTRPWISAQRGEYASRPHIHTHTFGDLAGRPGRRLISFASSRRTNLFTMYTAGSNGRVEPIERHVIIFRKLRRVARVPREIESRLPSPPSVSTSLLRVKPNRINSRHRTVLARTPN